MQTRPLGPFQVSAIGLGCMSLSHAYGPPPPREQAERVLLGALDAGYTFFDTAAVYGLGHNERLVGEVLGPHRDRFVLASKCGLTNGEERDLNGSPERLKATCDESLKRLGVDVIDLYYLHRWDKRVPIEESVGALADLVKAGKIRTIGLSEVSAPTLRRAHATHPIAALQTEYSPWTRNPEIAVLGACRELGVESHLVMSRASALTLSQETALSVADVQAKAEVPDWTTLEVGMPDASVPESLIQQEIEQLQTMVAELVPVEGRGDGPARRGGQRRVDKDVPGVIPRRIEHQAVPLEKGDGRGDLHNADTFADGRQILKADVQRGGVLRRLHVEGKGIGDVARPVQLDPVAADLEPGELVDRARRRVIPRQPFGVQQHQIAAACRDRNRFAHPDDPVIDVRRVDGEGHDTGVRLIQRRGDRGRVRDRHGAGARKRCARDRDGAGK